MIGAMEDAVIIGGLIAVQFIYAGNSVLLSYQMSLGFNPLIVVICTASATFLFLCPLAVYFERSNWPKKLTFKLIFQLIFISFGGVTLFQTLLLKGIKLTSPTMATAMPNLAPGLIFIIAWCFRLERIELSCMYSRVKILGTLLCVVGAITMSILHSTMTLPAKDLHISLSSLLHLNKDKLLGCLYLVLAVFVLSSNVVLQATTLRELPAPMSLSAVTSFIGVFTTAVVHLLQSHEIETNWSNGNTYILLCCSLFGGIVGGISLSFNGWAMKKRGPVVVSIFSPIGTVISVLLSVFTLGDTISIGSLGGMLLMFCGLYFVLWAKGKEGYSHENGHQSDDSIDLEKHLLS